MVLEKTLESPLDHKEIKSVNPKGNQPWIFIGRTDANTPILWPPDAMSWLIGKDPDAGKDWGQKEKGATEDENVEWHHRLNGYEFKQTPRDSEDREPWRAAVHGVARSRTQLSDWTILIPNAAYGQQHRLLCLVNLVKHCFKTECNCCENHKDWYQYFLWLDFIGKVDRKLSDLFS